jgi:hypothetical protein
MILKTIMKLIIVLNVLEASAAAWEFDECMHV